MIDRPQPLEACLERIRQAPWIALDTEADSLHAYPEKLCLLQISLPGEDFLVDPLADLDLAPLFDALSGRELIFHAADYDLKLLRRHHDFKPHGLFDTMLAARLVGCPEFGLAHLAQRYLGVALEKGPQRADWARRPLTERMETYARNDTRHLKALVDKLTEELQSKGRLEWHREWCARFLEENSRVVQPDPDQVWRMKGSNKLTPRGLAYLRELWRWREGEATAASRPPFFVLSHELLLNIAQTACDKESVEGLLPKRMSPRRRKGIRDALRRGQEVAEDECPRPERGVRRRRSEAQKKAFDRLQEDRDKVASRLEMDPTLIASRAMMLKLSDNWDAHVGELMNWQRELLLQARG